MPYPKEELLHHIWQHRLFDASSLVSTEGEGIDIIRPGRLNSDAGPDFSAARLKIGEAEWSGNVEIHVRSSDWLKHSHQHDSNYSNIILHVVFEDDLIESLGAFPTLELKPFVSDQVLGKYQMLVGVNNGLACGRQFTEVPNPVLTNWLDSLLVKRLKRKSESIQTAIEKTEGDLEQAVQMVLFRSFGMKVNAEPFEHLGMSVPWKILAKYQDNLLQLEAILFGYAGFLNEPIDDYHRSLAAEFRFIQNKHGGVSMPKTMFKFSKMHPKNFPTLRLAQLAALYHRTGQFLRWFANREVEETLRLLQVQPSDYWQTHYRFGKAFEKPGNRLGSSMANNILINVLAPFLFVQAERESKQDLKEKAFETLEVLRPELNAKTRKFKDIGYKCSSAFESQALIELYAHYCEYKKCLSCNIGASILKRES